MCEKLALIQTDNAQTNEKMNSNIDDGKKMLKSVDLSLVDKDRLKIVNDKSKNFPSGTSIKNLMHMG